MYQEPRSYKLNLESSIAVLILYSKSDKILDKQTVRWWAFTSGTEFSNQNGFLQRHRDGQKLHFSQQKLSV